MPMRNGTGPQGMGPMTGRGMGPCNPNGANIGYGYGMGRGMGFSRGMGCRRMGFGYGMGMNMPVATPETRKSLLEQQKAFFRESTQSHR